MAEAVLTAGAQGATSNPKPSSDLSQAASPRREAIRLIRQALRNQAASDDEVDDALEALVELSKD